jgi:hypothetical protein
MCAGASWDATSASGKSGIDLIVVVVWRATVVAVLAFKV